MPCAQHGPCNRRRVPVSCRRITQHVKQREAEFLRNHILKWARYAPDAHDAAVRRDVLQDRVHQHDCLALGLCSCDLQPGICSRKLT